MNNCAHHGAHYTEKMKSMEELYPENNKIMQCIFVEAQDILLPICNFFTFPHYVTCNGENT